MGFFRHFVCEELEYIREKLCCLAIAGLLFARLRLGELIIHERVCVFSCKKNLYEHINQPSVDPTLLPLSRSRISALGLTKK